jgi:alanyl-tRNA synthetase
VHAGNLVKAMAQICGGGGGGRPDMATAGGKDPAKLGEALQAVPGLISAQVGA